MLERCFSCLLVLFPCLKGIFPLLERYFPLAWKGFSLFGKVFPCLERFFLAWKGFSLFVSVPSRKSPTPPSKLPRNPKTFRYFVPRGTPVQSRISRSLFLIALYTCLIQCIDNKTNKETMIIGRASPVAITYRPNSNAMYQQNKVSTKYINIPIKNIQ